MQISIAPPTLWLPLLGDKLLSNRLTNERSQLKETDELLKFFDGGYLINLPHRQDRLRSARRELDRVGWHLGETGVELYPAQTFDEPAGFPSIGARGCFDSHLQCLRRA